MKRRHFVKSGIQLGAGLALPAVTDSFLNAAQMPADIVSMSALALSAAIRAKQVSCTEVMQAYLAHIHRYNPVYNAIVGMPEDASLFAQAQDADVALSKGDYRGWMHGMPHAIKDLTATAGLRFTNGSPLFADRIADTDGGVSASIRAAGAIFIGKTNAPEFGLGSQTYNPVFGATGSACNPALTAGGSSGGAGSGLGTRMLPVADGSDMMGSLRNPGAYNNIIGFRPSANVMSANTGAALPLSTSGPMGRNTADTIRLFQTIAVQPVAAEFTPLPLQGLRIGWLGNLDNYLAMEAGVTDLCEASLATLASAGAAVESHRLDFNLQDLWQCWTTLRHSGRGSLLQYYDNPQTHDLLKPELIWEIEESLKLGDADIASANAIRGQWMASIDTLFGANDFLAIPTAQLFPYPKDIHWPLEINGRVMDTYHRWMEVTILGSLGGLPVINVPVGFDAQGRPMGMQILGRFGTDQQVLEFGLAYEQTNTFLAQQPPLVDA